MIQRKREKKKPNRNEVSENYSQSKHAATVTERALVHMNEKLKKKKLQLPGLGKPAPFVMWRRVPSLSAVTAWRLVHASVALPRRVSHVLRAPATCCCRRICEISWRGEDWEQKHRVAAGACGDQTRLLSPAMSLRHTPGRGRPLL